MTRTGTDPGTRDAADDALAEFDEAFWAEVTTGTPRTYRLECHRCTYTVPGIVGGVAAITARVDHCGYSPSCCSSDDVDLIPEERHG